MYAIELSNTNAIADINLNSLLYERHCRHQPQCTLYWIIFCMRLSVSTRMHGGRLFCAACLDCPAPRRHKSYMGITCLDLWTSISISIHSPGCSARPFVIRRSMIRGGLHITSRQKRHHKAAVERDTQRPSHTQHPSTQHTKALTTPR